MDRKITINQEYIVRLNATIESDLSEQEVKEAVTQLPNIFREMIISEITGGVGEVDVAPVRHGHWINENLGFGAYRYRCSECGNIYGQDQIEDFEHNKFCGDCGIKMAEIK